MFSLTNRGKMPQAIQEEFERLFSKLRGFLSQAFDEDGQLVVADPNLAVIPVGGLTMYAGTSAPTGYLMCDGTQVSRVTYKSLFDIIGITYGSGDGSTTFNIPDLRQKFPLGKASAGTGSTLGTSGGTIDHTHGGGTLAAAFSGTTSAAGGHAHVVDSHQHNISADGSHNHTYSGTVATTDAGSTFNAGGGGVPVTTDFHQHTYSGSTSTDGSHSHGGATSSTAPNTSAVGDHTHTFSGTTSAATGTSGTANPPYVVVNYIIFTGV